MNKKEALTKYEAQARSRIGQLVQEECGGSQQRFAERTHLNKASVSQYVNGRNTPSNLTAKKIADAFNVNAAWVMGFDVPKSTAIENEIAYQTYLAEGKRQDAAALDRLLSPDEREVLFAYRESPGPVKQVIRRALGLKEAESSTGSSKVG